MRRLAWVVLAGLLMSLSGCILFFGSSEEILYEETFSTPSAGWAWTLGSFTTFDKWIDNGKYYVLVKEAATTIGYDDTSGSFADMQVDLDVDHILGADNWASGGLIFRVTNVNNMYAFQISPVGTFTIAKWVAGTPTTLLAWAASPAINKGVARNHLTVVAVGPSMSFFVNNTEVAMLTDTSLPSGKVGVIARAFDANVDVVEGFDNLIVQSAGD